jgi:hypothetical protein
MKIIKFIKKNLKYFKTNKKNNKIILDIKMLIKFIDKIVLISKRICLK